MSLDVYLIVDEPVSVPTRSGIFIRENGQTVEITRHEWNARYGDREPVFFNSSEETTNRVYSANITHNLNDMAEEAGIYQHLWRPEELGITKARQLIEPLSIGLSLLRRFPDQFKKHNPLNGWGSYDGLVGFVADYIEACCEWPDANVEASR